MCSGSIYWAGLRRVVFGCTAKALGTISGEELDVPCAQVLSAGKLHSVELCGPVLEQEAEAMHRDFWPKWSGEHFGAEPEDDSAVATATEPAESGAPGAHFGYTIVYVADPAASLSFFERAFGFERTFVTPENDYGQLATGATKLAFAAKALAKSNLDDLSMVDVDGERPLGMEVAVVTEDVPKAVENAVAAGATVLKAACTKPWGQTVAYVRAPDGTLVELCTPIGGSS